MKKEYKKLWDTMQKVEDLAEESRKIIEELMQNDNRKILDDMDDDMCEIMEMAAIIQYKAESL